MSSSLNASASNTVGAADATLDFSTLISTEPNVNMAASNMERTTSDSAESYTTIFDSPNWESELLNSTVNNADANTNLWSVPLLSVFDDTSSLDNMPSWDDITIDSLFPLENEEGPTATRYDSMSPMHKASSSDLFENNPSCGSLDSYFNFDPCYGLEPF
jgi:hypothetical protein